MTDRIGFGLVSCAHPDAEAWASAVEADHAATLVGVWDDDPARGQAVAQHYGTIYHADLTGLLAACDAVGIASETAKHAAHVEVAVRAGVHVLLHSPLAGNLPDAERIDRAVSSSNRHFVPYLPLRHDPAHQAVKQYIEGNAFGQITRVHIRRAHDRLLGDDLTAVRTWQTQPELAGGGVLIDDGVQAADALRWWLGEPQHVSAMIASSALRLPIEDTASAMFGYANGTLAQISVSGVTRAADTAVEIYGTGGTALLSGVDPASCDFARRPYLRLFFAGDLHGRWEDDRVVPQLQHGDLPERGVQHFLACLRGEAEPLATLDDAWKALAMIEAAYRSAQIGRQQPLDFRLSGKWT